MNRSVFLVALLLLASACGDLAHDGAFDPESPPEKQAKTTLSGMVALEGEPDASGVTVELQGTARTYTVQSDADGTFRLAGVTPGFYDITFKTRHFVEQTDTLTVPLGEEVMLSTRRLLARRSVVIGSALIERLENRVLTEVGGAEILLTKTASVRGTEIPSPASSWRTAADVDTLTLSTLADTDGNFVLNGVPAGVYRLVITGTGGETSEVDGVEVTGEAPTVTLEPIIVQAVTGYFEIVGMAGDAESSVYTNTPVVTLRLDGFNAVSMRLGTSTSGAAADCVLNTAVPYLAEEELTLVAEGESVVCVQFIGADGRTTAVLTDSILYDGGKPFGTVLGVAGGAEFVTSGGGDVNLALTAFDELSRLNDVRIANLISGDCTAALDAVQAEPFVTVKAWTLANPANAAAGYRTVCARFADAAGNWSDPVSDTVYFDPLLYAPGFTALVRGAENRTDRTRGAKVTVQLAFTGAATDVTAVLIANDSSFAGVSWRAYAATVPWSLEAGDGLKTVYVKVRDFAGNESARLQPQITLDQTGPETPVLALNDVNGDSFPLSSTTVELGWTTPAASDLYGFEIERYVEGLDVQFMALASPGAGASTLVDDAAATSGYTHHYRIRARDDLGNISSYSTVLSARPFMPVESLQMLRGESEARYFVQPLAGTFLVSTDWLYENPFPGDAYRDQLGFNVLEWSRSATFGGFNDEFVIRTSNVDNTLVYESSFVPGHDQRGFGGQSLGGGTGPSLGVSADGSVGIIYSNGGIFHATNESGAWTAGARYPTTLLTGPKAAFAPNGNIIMPHLVAIAFGVMPIDLRIDGVWSTVYHPDDTIFNPGEYAVRMDTSGNAYLAYGAGWDDTAVAAQKGVRVVVRKTDTTWTAYNNFDGAAVGTVAALSAARGSSRFCFSYMLAANLRYACRHDNTSTSAPATVAGAAAANATAIGVKSDGNIVIAYVETSNSDLKVWDQSTGVTTTIHGSAAQPVMAVGSDNTLYLAFRTATTNDLMFYHNASGTWSGRTLSSQGNQGYAPSIALGPDGKIHIAYGDAANGQLGYVVLEAPIASRVGSKVEAIDTETDANGNIHVAYRWTTTGSLYYGLWNGTTWSATFLDSDMSLTTGASIVVDPAGKAHVVYANEADNAIRYATNASNAWVTEGLVVSDSYTTPRMVIADGVAHILASGRYIRGTAGSWTSEVIPGQPEGPGDITVDATGKVHVVSYPAFLVDIGALQHRHGTFGDWTAGFSSTGWYDSSAIGATPDGRVHIVAELNGDAIHVAMDGSTYTRRTIDSGNDVGRGIRFAFDAEGYMHLVYGDVTNSAIRYATDKLTGAFQSIELAKSSSLNDNNVFFAPDGSPVVTFGNGDVVLVQDFLRTLDAESVERTTAY